MQQQARTCCCEMSPVLLFHACEFGSQNFVRKSESTALECKKACMQHIGLTLAQRDRGWETAVECWRSRNDSSR